MTQYILRRAKAAFTLFLLAAVIAVMLALAGTSAQSIIAPVSVTIAAIVIATAFIAHRAKNRGLTMIEAAINLLQDVATFVKQAFPLTHLAMAGPTAYNDTGPNMTTHRSFRMGTNRRGRQVDRRKNHSTGTTLAKTQAPPRSAALVGS